MGDEEFPSPWKLSPEPSGPEIAFADALERLLDSRPFHEISVELILGEAGLARSTFYSYFSAKQDVLTMLVARIYDELFESISPWWTAGGAGTRHLLQTALQNSVDAWARHGPVLAATMETLHTAPELRKVISEGTDRATLALAEEIRRERRRGAAPPGPPAEAIAGVIAWSAERLLYIGERGLSASIPDLDSVSELLRDMAIVAVYGPAGADGEVAR